MMGKAVGKQPILMLLLALLTLLPVGCVKVNDTGKTLYFKGESENWKGLIINTYQESWSKDESGRLRNNNAAQEELFLKYKSADNKETGQIRWEYKCSSGGGASGEDINPEPERFGYISCGGRDGQGVALTSAGDSYTLTVEWNGGKKETFELVTSEKRSKQTDLAWEAEDPIKPAITDYLENKTVHSSDGTKFFAEYELFGVSGGDEKFAYLWVLSETYSYDRTNDRLVLRGGSSLPMVLSLKRENGGYIVTGQRVPGDGSRWLPDVKEMFPREYHERILNRAGNAKELETAIKKRAMDYFKSQATNKGLPQADTGKRKLLFH